MSLRKIIFLLLPIIFFSCKTQLEKEGWQRIPIVSQVDTSAIKKEKELVVQKIFYEGSPFYQFYISKKDSAGKIICIGQGGSFFLNSDLAYYKLESDSVCLVKLLKQGNVQAYLKIGFGYWSRFDILYEPKNSQLKQQGTQGTTLVSRADSSGVKNDKELIAERWDINGKYYYSFTSQEKDPAGKIINNPLGGLIRPFKSDIADYKWESDSVCVIRLMSHGNVQASFKYIEHGDSSSSFGVVNDLKQ